MAHLIDEDVLLQAPVMCVDTVLSLAIFAPLVIVLLFTTWLFHHQALDLQKEVDALKASVQHKEDYMSRFPTRENRDKHRGASAMTVSVGGGGEEMFTKENKAPRLLSPVEESELEGAGEDESEKQKRKMVVITATTTTSPSTPTLSETSTNQTAPNKKKLNNNTTPFQQDHTDPESLFKNIRPIGYVDAPFSRRALIPRQSQMAEIQSTIKMRKEIQPQFSFTGIEEYNYCWVIFSFHANTNISTEKRYIKALINPPRSPDKKYGIYATRTPHRHNNIGLSLAKIVGWDKKQNALICSGLDLLDGTPILDIKPVHPCEQHTFSTEHIAYPPFVAANHTHTVEWEATAIGKLQDLVQKKHLKSYPFATHDNFKQVLDEILTQQDPRSQWHKGKDHDHFIVELYNTYIDLMFDTDQDIIFIKDVNPIPQNVVKQSKNNLHSLAQL